MASPESNHAICTLIVLLLLFKGNGTCLKLAQEKSIMFYDRNEVDEPLKFSVP